MQKIVRVVTVLLLLNGMVACVSYERIPLSIADIPPILIDGEKVSAQSVIAGETPPEILDLSPEIIEYFDRYVEARIDREHLAGLIRDVMLSPAFFDLEYERGYNFTASQTYTMRAGNCISFANLYIALARNYGLSANYQLLNKYPQWTKNGNLVFMDIHINTSVKVSQSERLTVDINQRSLEVGMRQLGGPRIISDDEAASLFYSNLGVREFADGNLRNAYKYFVWAVKNSPDQYFVWSNLGPIFRQNGQLESAEHAYLKALALEPESYSVVNNLAVLYHEMGREDDYQRYLETTYALRDKNPYFYFHLAMLSKDEGDYTQALEYLRRAIKLKDDDPEFHEWVDKLNVYLSRLAINDIN